uniref:Uncharacterized protein n=1 Tax=viral metagenome TaxID=1070528 RepID=A0A6C0D7G4_9ZZZZ
MPNCKGRLTSDITGKGKIAFLNPDSSTSTKYYYIPIHCNKDALNNSDLCGSCMDKEKKIESCSISKSGRLNGANGAKGPNHPAVLHGKVDDPIPIWSHIEGGQWFKTMLQKGYKKEVEMPTKTYDEEKIFAVISSLKGLKNKMVEDLIKQFPELSKHAASNFITLHNKSKINSVVENVVVVPTKPKKTIKKTSVESITEDKLVINTSEQSDVYDVVELKVTPITIGTTKYYYESKKDKVYTLDYKYVGRYDRKQETICVDYPDSDAEPNFA